MTLIVLGIAIYSLIEWVHEGPQRRRNHLADEIAHALDVRDGRTLPRGVAECEHVGCHSAAWSALSGYHYCGDHEDEADEYDDGFRRPPPDPDDIDYEERGGS
jgi:hypothetical protein